MAAAVQIHDLMNKNEHFLLQSTPCANVWTGAKRSNRITLNNSPKRQALLETQIKQLLPSEKHRTLIDVCRTRWVLIINGLIRFEEMYEPILKSLEIISGNSDSTWNQESCKDASLLKAACSMFDFIVALVTVRNCLAYIQAATVKLQQK